MCDTLAILGNHTRSGQTIFAKNSDREPNEAQVVIRVPALKQNNKHVSCTYISVPQVNQTYEIIISKPYHMWGAEIGCNENGVAIGNEAVFTNIPKKRKNTGLTGMDIVRLTLERSKSAKEAVQWIFHWVEVYGQDACGGFENKNFYYDNSFLIADQDSIWKVETAGHFAVAGEIDSFCSISNGLTFDRDFQLVNKPFQNLMKSTPGKGISFRKRFSDKFYTYMSFYQYRQECTMKGILHKSPAIQISYAMDILRSHETEPFYPHKASPRSVCMHATGLFCPNQTTGSMVVQWRYKRKPIVWVTGSSFPCMSVFKPLLFGLPVHDIVENEKAGLDFWNISELKLRKIQAEDRAYSAYRNKIIGKQQDILSRIPCSIDGENDVEDDMVLKESRIIWNEEFEDLQQNGSNIHQISPTKKGSFFYRRYWNKRNENLNLLIKGHEEVR